MTFQWTSGLKGKAKFTDHIKDLCCRKIACDQSKWVFFVLRYCPVGRKFLHTTEIWEKIE